MDVCSDEPPGASLHAPRPPLVASEKNNVVLPINRNRTREITSRYKSGITPTPLPTRRSPSPSASRALPVVPGPSVPKRAQSAERRRPPTPSMRPSTPSAPPSRASSPSPRHSAVSSSPASRSSSSSRPSTPSSPSSRSTTPVRDSIVDVQNSSRRSLGARAPDGLWPSMRSLSSSLQTESSAVVASTRERTVRNPSPDRTLRPSSAGERKRTPMRGRTISDQSENCRTVENSHARVIDQHRWPGRVGGKLSANAMSKSMDFTDKFSRSSSLPVSTKGVSPTRRIPFSDTAGSRKSANEVGRRVPSDGGNRVDRELGSGVNLTSQPPERAPSVTRSSRSLSLPIPSSHRSPSPNKFLPMPSSNTRGAQSPSRTRPSTPIVSSSGASTRGGASSSSILNYIADVRTGKKSANHMEDAHQLRLLYNRDLQWQFVNARANTAMSAQKLTAENILYNVWNIMSELRDSVILKRVNMQKLKQELKLDLILNEQIAYLEDWIELEKEHSSCLSGAFEALKASTLRLPVTGGARADARAVKNAVSSAVDVMQAMGTSICSLLTRTEGTNRVVSELSIVAAKERDMLCECRELLASTAAMQVQECSLRAHLLQLSQDVA